MQQSLVTNAKKTWKYIPKELLLPRNSRINQSESADVASGDQSFQLPGLYIVPVYGRCSEHCSYVDLPTS